MPPPPIKIFTRNALKKFRHPVTGLCRRVKIALWALLTAIALTLAAIARPAIHLSITAWRDTPSRLPDNPITTVPQNHIDDASHLNPSPMEKVIISADLATAKSQLRDALKRAKAQGKKVTIAGSRHTMGGQTLYPNGLSLEMAQFNQMHFNPTKRLLTVQSGATWSAVIPYLNTLGYSAAIMQSNNDFSVGGTLSANAHGWQHNSPPFASSVESFRLMLANGTVVNCSRQENSELFSLVLGGYGLFGIVLDVDLKVVENERYAARRVVIPSQSYVSTYRQATTSSVGMAYGRLSVAPDNFLREAILTTYHKVYTPQNIPNNELPLENDPPSKLARTVFRGSVGSAYGKRLRWKLEKLSGSEAGNQVSRNQILNRSSTLFANYQPAETEILHEYFIPPDALEDFLQHCRQIIPSYNVDLLNVTIRNVYTDSDSFLHYADQEMFGLVMLFHQQRSTRDDANMQALTQALISAALETGGRYYLPYRLHASPAQFQRAYPQAQLFFQLKRKYDPNELFQNGFYRQYGKAF
jgi:FAD/FMN-containing dehydrogenase